MELGASIAFAAMPLEAPEGLEDFLVDAGLLSNRPEAGADDLRQAVVLRDAIARCAGAAIDGRAFAAADVATINSFAGDDPPVPVLRADGTRALTAHDPVRAGLAAIARDAAGVLAIEVSAIHRCASSACGRLFLDRSRAQRRRWCSMERCGNQSKAAAFRRRASL